MNADQVRSLQPRVAALLASFRSCFVARPTFDHLKVYVLGLLADLKRKSIEPMALAAGVPVRTLQEFLSQLEWDHQRAWSILRRRIMDGHAHDHAIGVIDGSAHVKQGVKTPGVQRQWCGETGKIDNCVVGQHLLYTDNNGRNPFSCLVASDLYLPESWADDRRRCAEAKIPETVVYRPKWRIAIDQVAQSIGDGVRFSWITFDEEYGSVPELWFELNRLGQRGVGEVRCNFPCWPTPPACHSTQAAHASKRVDTVCRHSPLFREQNWERLKIKDTTRGPMVWEVKAERVFLVDTRGGASRPTDRRYWLIVARNPATKETKYLISNAMAGESVEQMLRAAFARWQVEKWFERAKQEAGLGAFEMRRYKGLQRHWFCSALAMYFLAAETQRLRGEKSADHAGAGGGSHQRPGGADLASMVALAG